QLEKEKADLVCLDFNLSDSFSGPELAERIKSKSPSTQILFLLGTFDTVDDATMEKCGAADKIVKPFDSNKFISICKQLTHEEPGVSLPPQETSSFDNLESQWKVNDTVEKITPQMSIPDTITNSEPDLNALDKEMSDWGMSIPGVINEGTNDTGPMVDLPPVIETMTVDEAPPQAATPSEADLEYPEIKPREQKESKESKLISLENFNDLPEEIEFEDNFTLEHTDIDHLEEMIKDEVEADLWKADEFEDLKNDVSDSLADFDN